MPISKVTQTCLECKDTFQALANDVRRGGGKYCSRKCYYAYLPKLLSEKNDGMKMTYTGVHAWIKRHKGMPSLCEQCGTTEAKNYDWANISREYKRDFSDWIRLCRACHMKYDNHALTRKNTLIRKYGTTDYNTRDKSGKYIAIALLAESDDND